MNRIDVTINARGDAESAATNNDETQASPTDLANINLQVAKNIFLDNNALISARASENADGGNLNIDTEFIIAVHVDLCEIVPNSGIAMASIK